MAKLFLVNLPDGVSSVKLDSQGRASVQYTVKNVSARELDGRAVLISLPQAKPANGPVEKGWVKVDGNTDRHFGLNKEETYTVKIAVPPKSPAGNYTFRLDTVWVDQPDQGDPGRAIAFTVAETKPNGHFPLWIIPVVLLVLIGIGVGTWLALSGGPKVPRDLIGKTVTDADAELKTANLTLDTNFQYAQSQPADANKIVDTTPRPGQKAKKGQAVQVTLGVEMVTVPQLFGHTYQEALGTLNDKHLTPGKTTQVQNPNLAGGVVVDQSPAPGQTIKSGSPVDLQVTPQTVVVPNVAGQYLGDAIKHVQPLTVASFSGDSTKTVTAQTPPAGQSVPVSTTVTLTFPPPPGGCAAALCFYGGAVARQMVYEHVMITRDAEKRKLAPQ